MKIKKKNNFWGVGVGSGGRVGGQGGCEGRIEVFGKIHKKIGGGGGGRRGSGGGRVYVGQGGCERNVWGRGVMWGMGDVNQE